MFILGCSNPCSEIQRRGYMYGDKVEVINGFYKGQKGIVFDKSTTITKKKYSMFCIVPAFDIRLENGNEIQSVSQLYLHSIR